MHKKSTGSLSKLWVIYPCLFFCPIPSCIFIFSIFHPILLLKSSTHFSLKYNANFQSIFQIVYILLYVSEDPLTSSLLDFMTKLPKGGLNSCCSELVHRQSIIIFQEFLRNVHSRDTSRSLISKSLFNYVLW